MIHLLANKSSTNGVYKADVGRLTVKLPNVTNYVSAATDDSKGDGVLVLLFGISPMAEMLKVERTLNDQLKISLFNFKDILPMHDCKCRIVSTGYNIDNDAYVYYVYFGGRL
jgi:hypothetical protein